MKIWKQNNNKGFSLLEVLLVVALIGIVAGFSAVVYTDFQTRNELDLTTQKIAQSLRTAQLNSQTMKNDSTWGVYIASNEITVFEGPDYAGRNVDSDFIQTFSTSISHTGLDEIVFSKYYGVPDTTGAINLATTNNSSQLTLNEKGTLDY
ncbi:prepilin-type N-terminal cleavage/methylation domain-containing protein [Candidatus Dojkabacteria bacterium]|nr:prepilin-type N-terminal cleavage/methylation domain-containing protein [Candidatus Dojkabacteria bacterium]